MIDDWGIPRETGNGLVMSRSKSFSDSDPLLTQISVAKMAAMSK